MPNVSLRVSAPPSAYNADRILSHYGHGGKPARYDADGDWFDRFLNIIPPSMRDAVFSNLHLVNRVWFPSRPAGVEIAREAGSWSFAVVGDYGNPTISQRKVAENIARSGAKLILTTGDNDQANGTEADFQRNWDSVYGPLSKQIPMFPSVGNHDGISPEGLHPYRRRFPHLGGARYYSHVQGPIHFIALDTNQPIGPGSDQVRWLEQELASSRSQHRVVYMHHPMFTQLKANQNQSYEELGPMLRRHGVKLVLTGHEHYYERSNVDGLTHVVVGNGGSTVMPFPFPQAPWSAFRDARYGHLEIEVQSNRLVGRMIDRNGTVADSFSVAPSQAVDGATQGAQLLQPFRRRRTPALT
jgi:hypothetical protein